MANWQAFSDEWLQGSYPSPVPAPDVEPDAAPTVCVQVNAAWIPYVLGALYQLTQPAAWDPASAGVADATKQAQGLMALIGGAAGGCEMIRITNGCELQQTTDGGATWTAVDGWDAYAATCFAGPPGSPPGGPIGTSGPGVPPIQPGQTTADLACSVAGYLAKEWIQASLEVMTSEISAGHTVLQAVTALSVFIPEIGPFIAEVVNAGAALYAIVTGGTLSDYEDAATDPVLLSDVTCAIYSATSGDGYVTQANFAAVVAAIGAIGYVHADVITALVSYLNAGGAILLQAAQLPGALAVVDCSGCGGPSSDAAMFFQGSSGSRMAPLSNIDPGSELSFMAWYNSGTGGQNAVIAWLNKTVGTNAGVLFYLSGGNMNLFVQHVATNVNIAGPGIPAGNHLIGFSLGPTNGMVIYLDGVAVASGTPPASPWGDGTDGSMVAADQAHAENLVAVMWRMGYGGVELSAADFAAAYAAGTFGAPAAGLSTFWRADDGSGTTVADVLDGNPGAIAGDVVWTTHT